LIRTWQVRKVGAGRLWLCLVCVVSTVALSIAPVMLAGAARPPSNAPLGFWNSYAYITDWGPTFPAHKPPGGPFPTPTTITSYDPTTGAFSGIDNAWGIGLEKITGTLYPDGAVTYTIVDPGEVMNGKGTITFNADRTTAIWRGTWSNSIGEIGTDYGEWKGFVLTGKVEADPCGAHETECSVPPTPVSGVTITATGAYHASATTDSQGDYSMTLNAGTWTITPTMDDLTFTPRSRSVDLKSDTSDVDFETVVLKLTSVTPGTSELSADVHVTLQDPWTDKSGCDPSASYHFSDPDLASAKEVSPCNYELTFDEPGTGIYHIALKATDRLGEVTSVSVDQFGRTVDGKFDVVIDSCSQPEDDVPDVDALVNADDGVCAVTVGDWDTDAADVAAKVLAAVESSPTFEVDPVSVDAVDPSDWPGSRGLVLKGTTGSKGLVLKSTGWVPTGTKDPPDLFEGYLVPGEAATLATMVHLPPLPHSWGGAREEISAEGECGVKLDAWPPYVAISSHGLWYTANGLVRVPAGDQISTYVPIGSSMIPCLTVDVDTGHVHGADRRYLHVYTAGQLMPNFTFVHFDGEQGEHVVNPDSPVTLNNLIRPGEGPIAIGACATLYIPAGATLEEAFSSLPVRTPGSGEVIGHRRVTITQNGELQTSAANP